MVMEGSIEMILVADGRCADAGHCGGDKRSAHCMHVACCLSLGLSPCITIFLPA